MSEQIRPGEPADIFRLQEIERDAATLFHGWPGIDVAAIASVISLSDHLRSIDQGLSVVIESEGRIAGFAIGDMQGEDVYLRELDVARDYQKRGYGALLVGAFVEAARARGARDIYLATFRSPPWNAPFYRKLGFRDVDRADYHPWMTAMEDEQASFLDLSTRVFMKLR